MITDYAKTMLLGLVDDCKKFESEISNNEKTKVINLINQQSAEWISFKTTADNFFDYFSNTEEMIDLGNEYYAILQQNNANGISIHTINKLKALFEDILLTFNFEVANKSKAAEKSGKIDNIVVDSSFDKYTNNIVDNIFHITESLITKNAINYNMHENAINDQYVIAFQNRDVFQIYDQTRCGKSYKGKDLGSVDIKLGLKNNQDVVLIEALKLNCLNKEYINYHFDKAINKYNPLRLPTIILIYSGVSNFEKLWMKYMDYIKDYKFSDRLSQSVTEILQPNAITKACFIKLKRDGFAFPVISIMVNLKPYN